MSFLEHLGELRSSLIRVMVILLVAFGLCYLIGEPLVEFLLRPLRMALATEGIEGKVVYLSILDKVLAHFQLAFWSAIILSSPLWFYEVWRFIAPGLYLREKKIIAPFIGLGFLLFVLGVCFGYFLALPLGVKTLMSFGVEGVEATIGLREYLLLSSRALVFLGLLFQLPNALLILGFMGLATHYSLRRSRRYVYFSFSVVSALLTPADIVTMLGLWLPMVILYELGVLAVRLIVHPFLARQNCE